MGAKGYNGLAQKYLEDGKKLLGKKDYSQASEKFWGAAATTTKAVGEKLGIPHDGHRQLFKVIDKVTKKTRDPEILDLFESANGLHKNFYENWLSPEQVEHHAKRVERLIEKLSAVCNGRR